MRVVIRPARDGDARVCGRICYEAFCGVARKHGFPLDWRTEDMAVQVIEARLAHRFTYGVVAEVDGRVAGSAFLKVYRPVGGIGPVTVAPRLQGCGVGELLMEHLLGHARKEGLEGTRLVQAAYNPGSLSLYIKLGFEVRALLACLHGRPLARREEGGCPVRAGAEEDLAGCNELCMRLQGFPREEDLIEALGLRALRVVEREGRITGYTTGIHFRGHTVGETNEDAQALIAEAETLPDPGVLMPVENGSLVRWALRNGLRITQPLSLMTQGFYKEPAGAFLPSIHA